MKKESNNLILPFVLTSIGVGTIYFLSRKVGRLKDNLRILAPKVKYNKQKSNAFGLVFDAEISVLNPETYSQFINNIFIEIILKNKIVSRGQLLQKTTILPNDTTIIKFPFSVNPITIGLQLFELLTGGDLPEQITVKGFVTIPSGRIEINEIVNLNI